MSDVTFPELIKQQMERRGHSANDISEVTGINQISVRNSLGGKSFPNKKSLESWARYLEIDPQDLLELKPAGRKRGRRKQSGAAAADEPEVLSAENTTGAAASAPRSSAEHAAGNGASSFCELEFCGNRLSFRDAAELRRFLEGEGAKVRIFGRERRLGNIVELAEWAQAFLRISK